MSKIEFSLEDLSEIQVLDETKRAAREPSFPNKVALSKRFFSLTQELQKDFEIDKGVLVLRDQRKRKLAAISTWRQGQEHDGLSLNLPVDSSLFEKVAEDGQVYTEEFCDSFSGNFFERKLLLDDDSRSFVLHPLKSDGQVIGLLGYSSCKPSAFAMFAEGVLDEAANMLGSMIQKKES